MEYSLSPLDAYKYLTLLQMAQLGFIDSLDDYLPNIRLPYVYRDNKPTFEELVTNIEYSDNYMINGLFNRAIYKNDVAKKAELLLFHAPNIQDINNNEHMYDRGYSVFRFGLMIDTVSRMTGDPFTRAQVQAMGDKFYESVIFNLSQHGNKFETINDFLNRCKLNTNLFLTKENFDSLSQELIKQATSFYVADEHKAKNIQKAMVTIFKKLSSYTIQFIIQANEDDLIVVENNSPGIDEFNAHGTMDTSIKIVLPISEPYAHGTADEDIEISITTNEVDIGMEVKTIDSTSGQLTVPTFSVSVQHFIEDITLGNVHYSGKSTGSIQDPLSRNTFVGIEFFNALTDEQTLSIKFIN